MHKDKLVKDLVMQYWDAIVQRRYLDLEAMSQSTYQYELALERLYGWDYMDIVGDKHSRRQQLECRTNWSHFSEDCIVIFGKMLGDLIQPALGVRVLQQMESHQIEENVSCPQLSPVYRCWRMNVEEVMSNSRHLA